MNLVNVVRLWLTALGVLLAPLLVFVLPPLLLPGGDAATIEEQSRLFAEQGFPFQGLAMQISGAVVLVPAVLGLARIVQDRRRGLVLGIIGLVLGMVSAFALLLALGFELGTAFVLTNEADTEVAVALGVAMSRWSVFAMLLGVGLGGFFVALPVLTLALWRSRVIPLVVPVLFLLPLLVPLLPLPATAANLVPSLALMLPCGWVAVQVLRRAAWGTSPVTEPVVGRPTESDVRLSTADAAV